jgi:hypothetical protein
VSAFAGEAIRLSFEWFVPESFTGPAFFQLDNITLTELPVAGRTLIIKQGACPAPVNPASNGLTPMLLVGDADFDVSQVILSSLQLSRCDGLGEALGPHLGPPGPGTLVVDLNQPHNEDIGCDLDQTPCACNPNQASDGIDDLHLWFNTSDMAEALMLDSELIGAVVTLFLTGELTDGSQFIAGDCIRINGPPQPPGLLVVNAGVPGVWVDVAPVDDLLDGGGFASFERAYPEGSTVQLTAQSTIANRVFTGWVVNGELLPENSPTIVVVLEQGMTDVFALYAVIPDIHTRISHAAQD